MHFLYHPHPKIGPKILQHDDQILNQNTTEFSSVVVVAAVAAFAVVGVVETHFCDQLTRRIGHR
jgi:hypothetical protein